jgi:hypothetical protein
MPDKVKESELKNQEVRVIKLESETLRYYQTPEGAHVLIRRQERGSPSPNTRKTTVTYGSFYEEETIKEKGENYAVALISSYTCTSRPEI